MGFVQFPVWCILILRVVLCYSRSVIRISRHELGPVLRADGCGRYVGLLSAPILLFVVRPLHEKNFKYLYLFKFSLLTCLLNLTVSASQTFRSYNILEIFIDFLSEIKMIDNN